jgi:hypothetical protein
MAQTARQVAQEEQSVATDMDVDNVSAPQTTHPNKKGAKKRATTKSAQQEVKPAPVPSSLSPQVQRHLDVMTTPLTSSNAARKPRSPKEKMLLEVQK